MVDLTSLTLRVIDSDPHGIKLVHVDGSSLMTVVVPRGYVDAAMQLPDIPRRGIYYLLKMDRGQLKSAWVGQTLSSIPHLAEHDAQSDWWNVAVLFLAPDYVLTLDVVSGLEAVAIRYLQAHGGSYEIKNSEIPRPYVSPYDESKINRLHAHILFVMEVLGYDLEGRYFDEAVEGETEGVFHTTKRGITAKGRYHPEDGSFEVLAGSRVDMSTTPGSTTTPHRAVRERRQRLRESGELVRDGATYVLKTTQHFDSPSMAAVFVLGGSQDGWTEWVDSEGRTLAETNRQDEVEN